MRIASICLRCQLRRESRAHVGRLLPARTYSQSVNTILDDSPEDALSSTLDRPRTSRRQENGPTDDTRRYPASRSKGGHRDDPRRRNRIPTRQGDNKPSRRPDIGFRSIDLRDPAQITEQEHTIFHSNDRAEIQKYIDRGDLEGAWNYYLQSIESSTTAQMQRQSSDGDPTKKGVWPSKEFILVQEAITSARWDELRADDSTLEESALPAPLTILSDMERRAPDNYNEAAKHAAQIGPIFLRLQAHSKDVFGTPVRRQSFHDVCAFLEAWVAKKEKQPPRKPNTILSTNRQFNPSTDDPPILHTQLYRFVDEIEARDMPIVQLAISLMSTLEYGLLESPSRDEFETYRHLVSDMKIIISNSRYTELLHAIIFKALARQSVPRSFVEDLLQRVASQSRLNTAELSKYYAKLPTDFVDVESLAMSIDKSLARYRERENLDLTEKMWRSFEQRLGDMTESDKADPALYDIFENFLITFRFLRRADHTVNVWNSMIRMGLTPQVRTWNVMLRGCHIGKQVDQLEQLWERMIKSGVQPNAISWGTRIHGLFKFGKVATGFQALSDLTQHHKAIKQKQKTEPPTKWKHPQPTVEIMNSALSGAADVGPEVVGKILSWGRSQNLNPDTVTYNVLLNVALGTNNRQQAAQIMQRMKETGVEPNSATFTVLLYAVLSDDYLSHLSPTQQQQQVMSYIRNLEADGFKVDDRSYALLLDRLLKIHDNEPAATAVLSHMQSAGITPTAHIHTILITHYFSRDPPDVAAVDALWQRIVSQQNYALDVIFYDRMLEGYARCGEMGKMMYFLTRMSKEGKRPGWLALTQVLRCMLDKGDRERARELVVDVKLAEGAVRSGVRGRKGYEDFWGLVEREGINVK